ncbi:hypothetical protein P20429_2129 [Pseudoalteromonas sp. BSi20429]|nr:hypothetical protein P20429_2129 [Pseudoalteromonas sp. BSi20429]
MAFIFERIINSLNLRFLIFHLTITAFISTLVSRFYSTYQAQKEQLKTYTKNNYACANKLASTTYTL